MKNLKPFVTAGFTGFAVVLIWLLVGCQVNQQQPATAEPATHIAPVPTEPATATPSSTAELAPTLISTATPVPTVSPTNTALPSITPTNTLPPPIKVAVPQQWMERVTKAVEMLEQESSAQEWLLTNAGEEADIALVEGEGHIFVENQPLVLAVPFTTEWEETTLGYAEEIVAEGHDLVELMAWSDLKPNQKALRIDGRLPTNPDYPLQVMWSLDIAPGFKTAAAELQKTLAATQPVTTIHMVAVGDIMLDRSLGFGIQNASITYPFEDVIKELQEADITVGNLESALGDIGQPAAKRYQFRAPPEAAESLALAGFDILSLANNHALDFGQEGLTQGIDLLHAQGIQTAGAGANAQAAHKPVIREVNGLRLAFLSYVNVPVEATTGFDTADWTASDDAPGLAWADPEIVKRDVEGAEPQSDLVVVLLHSGHEYVEAPSEPQVAAAHAAIESGADLVIGHHSHILQGIEFYGGGVIVYGTGNFAFEIDGDPETALFHIWLDEEGVRQIEVQPAVIQFGGQPRLADAAESTTILSQVYYLTNLLN